MTNNIQIADNLQTIFCEQIKGESVHYTSLLGSDYANNLPENFLTLPLLDQQKIIINLVEKRHGELPYYPMVTLEDIGY
jgi:hypothetical protein